MILIGRGLDLKARRFVKDGGIRRDTRNGVRRKQFQREEAESWSDKAESQACAVLRVRETKPLCKTNCDAE